LHFGLRAFVGEEQDFAGVDWLVADAAFACNADPQLATVRGGLQFVAGS